MFTLDVNVPEIKAAMFAQGRGVVVDTDIWHKKALERYERGKLSKVRLLYDHLEAIVAH